MDMPISSLMYNKRSHEDYSGRNAGLEMKEERAFSYLRDLALVVAHDQPLKAAKPTNVSPTVRSPRRE